MAPTTSTPPRERLRRGEGSGTGDAWKVVVLNDNHNSFDGVAFALARTIPGVSFERGLKLADRIHSSGKALVWSGDREAAEHYWEQLKNFGLTMAPLGS
jgi:ATP-dependent Clp protease adaptor protein ClpS